jgi:formimidoylglutamate deiminase
MGKERKYRPDANVGVACRHHSPLTISPLTISPRSGENAVKHLHFDTALLAEGWRSDVTVSIDGHTIFAIASGTAASADADRLGGIAIPGLANVHSHAFQRAMAGLAERQGPTEDSFWTWREVMYRFLAQMTPDDIEAVAALAYMEMLEQGFTRVGEFHYLHNAPDGSRYADPAETAGRIVAAAQVSGIGLTLLPSFYAHSGCGGMPPAPGQARFLSDLDGFMRLMEASRAHISGLEGARLGVAPHSLRAVDRPELEALCAAFPAGPIHIHAAEQEKEVAECQAWSGARPVQWLLENMPVDERWCLIHCTHMTAEETGRLARTGAVAGLCPITEANLGDGVFPATAFLAAGGRIAVGSDSNVRIAANEELRTLEYGQRLRDRRRNRLGSAGISTGRTLYDAARGGGLQAVGLVPARGLAAGQPADIVVLDADDPALVGRSGDTLLDAFVFAAGHPVRHVLAAGRPVVRDGRHIATDAIRARYAATVGRLARHL